MIFKITKDQHYYFSILILCFDVCCLIYDQAGIIQAA